MTLVRVAAASKSFLLELSPLRRFSSGTHISETIALFIIIKFMHQMPKDVRVGGNNGPL